MAKKSQRRLKKGGPVIFFLKKHLYKGARWGHGQKKASVD